MKSIFQKFAVFAVVLIITSCSSTPDEMDPLSPDPVSKVDPVGVILSIKEGMLMPQSGTNTTGMIELVSDEAGKYFLRLGNDFKSDFHTGTVTVYLSTSSKLQLSESGSFQKVGIVNESGEHFFVLPNLPESKFSHGIIWCGAAGIPFGYGSLN
ncbi:PBP1b-binding outer membrane lipoprotein LpoB [Algoriphagus iocasae]|uniref:PBP1b-binding outer membrane lipoprotein LpoB n=1 Tax=Algoriphagus iocasae TaxID=1836499 RepID=A0A841MJ46_9BACT|nr:hypothetical protein [Algoriphagus iocasae]MBB6327400.1 PBP1b-binding outer membrane lipoprotein LpoB [Algoriphagus iocasae]